MLPLFTFSVLLYLSEHSDQKPPSVVRTEAG